jgi:mono/diheme cytochrome c family protein
MKKTVWAVFVMLIFVSLAITACTGGGNAGSAVSGLKRNAVPSDYANMKNPYQGNQDAVAAGKQVFDSSCQTCHGPEAKGDGPVGASLNPRPANLQLTVKETTAPYMHWVVTEGGSAAGLSSSMPSFQGNLSDDDIWRVVSYLRSTYGGQ